MSRAPQRLLLAAAASAALAVVMVLVVISGTPASSTLTGGTIDLNIPADTMPRDDTPVTPATTAPAPTTTTTVRPATTTTAPATTTTFADPTTLPVPVGAIEIQGYGGLYGQVVDGRDRPVPGVCVRASTLDPAAYAVTDARGMFVLDGVAPGPATISTITDRAGCSAFSVLPLHSNPTVVAGLWTPVLLWVPGLS